MTTSFHAPYDDASLRLIGEGDAYSSCAHILKRCRREHFSVFVWKLLWKFCLIEVPLDWLKCRLKLRGEVLKVLTWYVIMASHGTLQWLYIIVTPDKESLSLDLKVCSKTKILVQQKNGLIFFSRNRCGWAGAGGVGAGGAGAGAGTGAGAVGSPTAPRVPRKVRPFFIHNALRLRKTKFFCACGAP